MGASRGGRVALTRSVVRYVVVHLGCELEALWVDRLDGCEQANRLAVGPRTEPSGLPPRVRRALDRRGTIEAGGLSFEIDGAGVRGGEPGRDLVEGAREIGQVHPVDGDEHAGAGRFPVERRARLAAIHAPGALDVIEER